MHPSIQEWINRAEQARNSGEKNIQKQHGLGKLTIRERLNQLVDAGSFQEIGLFVESRYARAMGKSLPTDGVVCGHATIDGRPVFVCGHDFTIAGGSTGQMSNEKMNKVAKMAMEAGVPLITLNDSGGGRLNESPDNDNFNYLFHYNILNSGWVPQLSAIMGPCAGGAAYSPALTDFVFIVKNTGNMFLTGPAVIQQVTGENIDKESLGGADAHARISGVAHFKARDDYECLAQIREVLSFLPQNAAEKPPRVKTSDDPARSCPSLDSIIPESDRRGYDIHNVVRAIVDDNKFVEVMKEWATNVVIGFGRMDGRSVGFICNQPLIKAGCLDLDASDKAARFIRFCDAFSIPIVYLVDTPGFLPGVKQEHGGILRHGAKLVYANCEATVPKITIVLRKMYGGCRGAMCGEGMGSDLLYYWPTAQGALVGAESAVNIMHRKKLEALSDAEKTVAWQKMIEDYNAEYGNPYSVMRSFHADEIIMPSDTRKAINQALTLLENKKIPTVIRKKHGNIPL